MLDSVVHLGNYLMMNLSDDLDIQMKSMDVIKQAKTALLRFNFVDSILKTRLFQSYCLSFYGGALWHLSSRQIKGLEVSYNNILHQIWSLSCMCITYCYCSPGCCIVSQYLKVACKALNHDSVLVQSVFKCSVESCSNFIGYNFLYGSYHSRVYNDHERFCSQVVSLTFMALSNLNSIFVNSNSLYVHLSYAPMLVCFIICISESL